MSRNAFYNLLRPQGGFDRNYGGTRSSMVADPYITGYHFIKFVTLPDLTPYLASNPRTTGIGKIGIQQVLAASCLSVTPPGGTLNKTEFVGLGGVKWAVPTNIDYGNTLTIKFLEFSNLPILSIFHAWVQMIRDYRTGTTQLANDDYTKSNYAGSILYWTTVPDGRTVEYAALYSGVFPTKDPQDLYSGDLTAVDKLEVDMEFSIDWVWHQPWVFAQAEVEANTRWSFNTPPAYRDNGNGTDTFDGR